MGWLIALSILILLGCLPLGVLLWYNQDGVVLKAVAGPISIPILPKKEKYKKAASKKKKEKAPKQPEGILYNIPGRAKMEIYSRTTTYHDKEIAIAQFGITEVLAKSLFGKDNTLKVLFDTATGGIISIQKD